MFELLDRLFHIAQIITIIQLVLVVICFFLIYLIKFIMVQTQKLKTRQMKTVKDLLYSNFYHQQVFSSKTAKKLKHHILFVLDRIHEIENMHSHSAELSSFLKHCSRQILKPKARTLARRRNWLNKYIAAKCFQYGFDADDDPMIIRLIQDPNLLVSMNACFAAIKYSNPQIINSLIDIFYKSRRVQQSVFSKLIARNAKTLLPILLQRLKTEANNYIKIFCYRLLCEIPPQEVISYTAKYDLLSSSADLRIAALNYVGHANNPLKNELIFSLACDPDWKIRAVVAKLLGNIHVEKSLTILNQLIKDSEWWVRINAANSLEQQGPQGFEILSKQDKQQDKYAYDSAQAVLTKLKDK